MLSKSPSIKIGNIEINKIFLKDLFSLSASNVPGQALLMSKKERPIKQQI